MDSGDDHFVSSVQRQIIVANVLKPDLTPGPIVVFATEAEVRAWIEEYRKKEDARFFTT